MTQQGGGFLQPPPPGTSSISAHRISPSQLLKLKPLTSTLTPLPPTPMHSLLQSVRSASHKRPEPATADRLHRGLHGPSPALPNGVLQLLPQPALLPRPDPHLPPLLAALPVPAPASHTYSPRGSGSDPLTQVRPSLASCLQRQKSFPGPPHLTGFFPSASSSCPAPRASPVCNSKCRG